MHDVVKPFSKFSLTLHSGGSRWCLVVMIVESLIQLIAFTSYVVICKPFSLPHVSYGVYRWFGWGGGGGGGGGVLAIRRCDNDATRVIGLFRKTLGRARILRF